MLRVLAAAVVGMTAVLLAGCGSSGSNPSSTPSTQTQVAAAAKQPAAVNSRHRAHAGRARDVVHRSGVVAVGYGHDSEPSAVGHALNPCTLVTPQEVAAIIGQPVDKAILAPLGPTCVYLPGHNAQSHRGKGAHHAGSIEVTLAVNIMNLTNATGQLRNAISSNVSGHREICGVIGHPVTYVSLTHGRVMTVTGPCPLAALIAEKALPRLRGA